VLWENGEFSHTRCFTKDITERKKVEDALRQSEERYRAFIAQSSEAIWRFELEHPIEISLDENEQIDQLFRFAYLAECNDAMPKMYGHPSVESMRHMRLDQLLVRSDHNIEYLRNFIRNGYRLSDAESHEFNKDGREKYFLNNLFGIVEDKLLRRAWGTQRDITEQKLVAEERERLLQQLGKEREELQVSRDKLQEKIDELERFHDVVVGRELRMIELEKEMQDLRADLEGLRKRPHDGK
jgi:hypothetical protein